MSIDVAKETRKRHVTQSAAPPPMSFDDVAAAGSNLPFSQFIRRDDHVRNGQLQPVCSRTDITGLPKR